MVAGGQVVEVIVELVLEPAGDAVARERHLPALQVAEPTGAQAEHHHREGSEPEMRGQHLGSSQQPKDHRHQGRRAVLHRTARDRMIDRYRADQGHTVVQQRRHDETGQRHPVPQALALQHLPDEL